MGPTWDHVREKIRSQVPKNSFELWINPITFVASQNGTWVLGCPNKFARNWVMENYLELIRTSLQRAGGAELEITLKVEAPEREAPCAPASSLPGDPAWSPQLRLPAFAHNGGTRRLVLNRDFTFERFIVGPCNEFAYSASRALAHENRSDYQTLLMLASTGLGKTHLSQAVGNCILADRPQTRVLYMTAEDFANDMICALKNNRIEAFKDKYRRGCDVLLLEEIHFLSGKEKTQTELGYTLDALANENKKIVFTSAIPPKDIPRMSKDLSSRLTSGLVSTIDNPDYLTRMRILEDKATAHGLQLPEEIKQHIAGRLKQDVRKMESAVKCLKAKCELLRAKLTLEMAKEVLACLASEAPLITSENVAELVCRYFKIDRDILPSKSRKKIHAYPRNIYIYLCRRHTDETLEGIANTVNRSHSTVLYASEIIQQKMRSDNQMKRQVEFLSQRIESLKT